MSVPELVDVVDYGEFESPWDVISNVLFNSGKRATVALGTRKFELKPVAVDNNMTYYHIPNVGADGIVCLRESVDNPSPLCISRHKEYYHDSKPVDFTGFSVPRYLSTSINDDIMMFDMYNNLGSAHLGYEPYIARPHVSGNNVLTVEVTFAWVWPQELREKYTRSTMDIQGLHVKSWTRSKLLWSLP